MDDKMVINLSDAEHPHLFDINSLLNHPFPNAPILKCSLPSPEPLGLIKDPQSAEADIRSSGDELHEESPFLFPENQRTMHRPGPGAASMD
jgi:hypothetical protein